MQSPCTQHCSIAEVQTVQEMLLSFFSACCTYNQPYLDVTDGALPSLTNQACRELKLHGEEQAKRDGFMMTGLQTKRALNTSAGVLAYLIKHSLDIEAKTQSGVIFLCCLWSRWKWFLFFIIFKTLLDAYLMNNQCRCYSLHKSKKKIFWKSKL